MAEDQGLFALRREVESELQQRAEKWRDIGHESAEQTRIHLDHWRAHVRQRYFDAWLDITARKLGKPREAVRLHTIPETYTLQDTQIEVAYLAAIGQIPHVSHEAPIKQQVKIEQLLDTMKTQIADTPIYILRGVAGFWLMANQDEPDWDDVCGNASSYFGAVEATSGEVFANAGAWLDEVDFVNTFISATDAYDTISLEVGHAHGLTQDPSYDGLACGLDLYGQQWGRLLNTGKDCSDQSQM